MIGKNLRSAIRCLAVTDYRGSVAGKAAAVTSISHGQLELRLNGPDSASEGKAGDHMMTVGENQIPVGAPEKWLSTGVGDIFFDTVDLPCGHIHGIHLNAGLPATVLPSLPLRMDRWLP